MTMHGVTVLGSTGSVGANTLDVISRNADRYRVVALAARKNVDALFAQIATHRPQVAAMTDATAAKELRAKLADASIRCDVLEGSSALETLATLAECKSVMAAIVGAAGLAASLAAARAGKRILLANKEALVMSGPIFTRAVQDGGAELLPVDSEHSALFQSLPTHFHAGRSSLETCGVRRLVLTASGGPFRTTPRERLRRVTPEQAVAHPNWVMGRKISVDSATMMNKGLEVIEAHYLFSAKAEQIDVVIHPQSVIHSMVEYRDGSVMAQLGYPDMRTPIACALAHPERIDAGVERVDFMRLSQLEFQALDNAQFPAVALAYAAMRAGGTAPAVLNAANEIAVEAFLDKRLPFLAITDVVESTLEEVTIEPISSLDHLLAADNEARAFAAKRVKRLASGSAQVTV